MAMVYKYLKNYFARRKHSTLSDYVAKVGGLAISSVGLLCGIVVLSVTLNSFAQCLEDDDVTTCADGIFIFAVVLFVVNFLIFMLVTCCCFNCFCGGCCFRYRRYVFRKSLRKFRAHPYITELDVATLSDDSVQSLMSLIKSTWTYDDHYGCDATNLHEIEHNTIQVLHFFEINNPLLVRKYLRAHEHNVGKFYLPPQLQTKPIQTIHVTNDVTRDSNVSGNAGPRRNTYLPDVNETSASEHSKSAIGVVRKSSAFDPQRRNKSPSKKTKRRKSSGLQLKAGITETGEAYLFHGTLLKNVMSIVETGFDTNKSQDGLYGKGVYLAESSQKADQYSDEENSRRSDFLTMFVVRTSLGRVAMFKRENKNLQNQAPPTFERGTTSLAIDSGGGGGNTIVGGEHKRFREFLKNTSADCYPQFLVVYNRVREDDNV